MLAVKATELLTCSVSTDMGSFWSMKRQPRLRASSAIVIYRYFAISQRLHQVLPVPQNKLTTP